MGPVPNIPVPVLRGIGVVGGYPVLRMGPRVSPTPHLCRARGQPPRCDCSHSVLPPRPSVALASWHLGVLPSINPGLPTPRDDPGMGVDQGSHRTRGNKISDAYSKPAARALVWDPSLLPSPPPPLGCISRGSLPVTHKLTTTSIKHLLSRHKDDDINVQSSFHFFNRTSWFKGLPSNWSTGNLNMASVAFHNDLRPWHCHA